MSSGKCRDFIQEEQLGVASGLHELSLPSFEFCEAYDPGFALLGSYNSLIITVQRAAAVAHELPSSGGETDGSARIDPVLQAHFQPARRVNAAATPAIINSDPPVRIATFITAGRRIVCRAPAAASANIAALRMPSAVKVST